MHKKIGQEKFQGFVKECLIERSKSNNDPIHRNQLKLFGCTVKQKTNKGKQQLASLKCDVGLFPRLYIGCQTRDGNIVFFFWHETKPVILVGASTLVLKVTYSCACKLFLKFILKHL